jgi:hypothetical protein
MCRKWRTICIYSCLMNLRSRAALTGRETVWRTNPKMSFAQRFATMVTNINAKYWVWGFILAWYLVVSFVLHPAVILYVAGHLLTTGVFVYAMTQSMQKALAQRQVQVEERGARRAA